MKLLTPGTPTTADLDHILSNTEKEGPPPLLPVFCAISDNFTQTSEDIVTTKQAYFTNSPGAHVNFIFNGGEYYASLRQRPNRTLKSTWEHSVSIFLPPTNKACITARAVGYGEKVPHLNGC